MPRRSTWAAWTTHILVMAAVIPGTAMLWPPAALAAAHGGWGLIAWMAVAVVCGLAGSLLESGTGCVLQGGLPAGLRRAHKSLAGLGWMAVAVAGGIALVALAFSAQALARALRGGGPAGGDGPDGIALVALAAILVAAVQAWRAGGTALARVAVVAVPVGASLALILAMLTVSIPGAGNGLLRVLAPAGMPGWALLADAAVGGMAALGLGWGLATALGSRLPRTREITATTMLGVAVGLLGVLALTAVTAIALGDRWPTATNGWRLALDDVPAALAAHLTGPVARIASGVWLLLIAVAGAVVAVAAGEVVVQSLVERLERSRERMSAMVGVAAGFAAVPLAMPEPPAAILLPLLGCLAVLASGALGPALAVRGGLSPLRRHLNAYSAITIGWTWQAAVAVLLPIVAVVALLGRIAVPQALAIGEVDRALLTALLLTLPTIAGGVWLVIIIVRGPQPVDPDAVTMENYEPVDFDTDIQTRVRPIKGTDPGHTTEVR
jgi:SNF family Na+-dependent transporter